MNNQQHRGVNFTLSSDLRKQKADPRANMALCVWGTLEQRVIIPLAGGQPRVHSWLPNEEGYATTDMESDQLHVPASVFRYGKGLSREPYDDLFGSTRLSQSGIFYFIFICVVAQG